MMFKDAWCSGVGRDCSVQVKPFVVQPTPKKLRGLGAVDDAFR
jgi:hypothetical protein